MTDRGHVVSEEAVSDASTPDTELDLKAVRHSLVRTRARDQMIAPLLDAIDRDGVLEKTVQDVLDCGFLLKNILDPMIRHGRDKLRPIPQLEAFKALHDLVLEVTPGNSHHERRQNARQVDPKLLTLNEVNRRMFRPTGFDPDWQLRDYIQQQRADAVKGHRKHRELLKLAAQLGVMAVPIEGDPIRAAHKIAKQDLAARLRREGGLRFEVVDDHQRPAPSGRVGARSTDSRVLEQLGLMPDQVKLADEILEVTTDLSGNKIDAPRSKGEVNREVKAAEAILARYKAEETLRKAEEVQKTGEGHRRNNLGTTLMMAGGAMMSYRFLESLQDLDWRFDLAAIGAALITPAFVSIAGAAVMTTGVVLQRGQDAIARLLAPWTVRKKKSNVDSALKKEERALDRYFAGGPMRVLNAGGNGRHRRT